MFGEEEREFSIAWVVPRAWNAVLDNVYHETGLSFFRRELKKFYLARLSTLDFGESFSKSSFYFFVINNLPSFVLF